MSSMDENEIARKFSEIVANEKLMNHPMYRQLMLQLDLATAQLFNFLVEMGYGDIGTIESNAIDAQGRYRPIFKYTIFTIDEEDEDQEDDD